VTGYDASAALISEARRLHPGIAFHFAHLPHLAEISGNFDNVLCETVIMHLPRAQIAAAVQALQRIVRSGGVLYLSWRATEETDTRQEDGRLYTAFPIESVSRHFRTWEALHAENVISASSGKRIHRLIARKNS
jgi:2-polyprenyl-3-methyl-5-hydroxy-6-metoxy-1,4-benzoquinol methylase